MSRDAGGGDRRKEAMKLPEWVAKAIEEGLGKVISASSQAGHEGSEPRLAILMDVDVPLNYQLPEAFPEGTLGAEMATRMKVTVKFSEDMGWVKAIVIRSEDYPKFYYTQSFINKKAGDLREIATQAQTAFFQHISQNPDQAA